MDRWTEIELFVQVAETGSLSRAAEALDLSNAAASRHLSALEARLGARLVERNTRRLYLTETGQEFFARAKGILVDLKDAESAVNATSLNPTGVLRITASLSFSMHHVAPLLCEYTQRYPNVSVHLEAANRYMDTAFRQHEGVTELPRRAGAAVKSDEQREADGSDILRTLTNGTMGSDPAADAVALERRLGAIGAVAHRWAFGEIWSRPELSRRDRSLVVVSILVAIQALDTTLGPDPLAQ